MTPTQTRYPARAALRTAVQTALAVIPILGLVVPEVVRIILEESGESMPANLRGWLLAASAVVVAVASMLARIMAIPAVNDALRKVGLSATPHPAEPTPTPGTTLPTNQIGD
jgi:hypothetical protein